MMVKVVNYNMQETVYITITGMHCPDCPKKVERSLTKLNGVTEVNVNYQTESGNVTFHNQVTNISEIINRIKKMGFEAKLVRSESEATIQSN
ncbi:heavy metal-associated domain-containing protein [Ornithinibacillus sp. FSL M8-0202]|uniref:heavy metal-associated domain-containing protein n=1 Tax=Ornithinibacillus sp. FSL M8-0202 TaxID=2921616 RepID=UPI0030D580E9